MIQSLSYIDPGAKIAPNVIIDPFSVIHKNVEIGEGTWIGSNVTIYEGARIGKNCKIFPGAVISAVPQDLKFQGEETTAIIGDGTTIRECVTINRGTKDKYRTEVGKNCLIMAYVHVAHDCIVGDNVIIANGVQLAGHVVIQNNVNIGGMCAVHQFVKVGKFAYVTGGSMVRKDVPPYIKVAKDPLSYAGINSVGMQRRGYSEEKIIEVQDIYRTIFLKKLNITQAMSQVELEFHYSEQRDEILNFIRNSSKGVVRSPVSRGSGNDE